ncbi:MAG: RNA polymerase sigma factor [Fimbriimonas sp.]
MTRILAGDRRAANRLVEEHYPRVLRFLRHLTGSAADAEDLAQQTFIRAREALPRFRFESSLSTWLHRIAYHEFTHLLRDRREAPMPLPERTFEISGRSEDAVVLAAAIADLPEDLRAAFVLREVQALSVREAAAILGVPEGTVKSRNHAARERLREALAGTWEVTNANDRLEERREPV